MQKLPIGIQSFADLRSKDYLYIDKTQNIHHLITAGKTFFLSRPRRFGKSLLVSTMEAIFQGQQELFKGLWIEDNWDWTEQHPVIRIDFGGMAFDTPEALVRSLMSSLKNIAQEYQIVLEAGDLAFRFRELIQKLHQTTRLQVVVLIDEYDKPIIDHITNLELADQNRTILHAFYQILKAADEHLQFLFLTGVSKFSKVSIFSGLNHLNDITLDEKYAAICGYTQSELEFYFDPYIEVLAQKEEYSKQIAIEKIKYWYDGYSWDGKTFVYNSFSTLLFFSKQVFTDHWFATGTPTFLVNLIKERNDVKALLKSIQLEADNFDSFDIQAIVPEVLMFQTGYLTVKKKEKNPFSDTMLYTLGVPNEEVNRALTAHLLASYAGISSVDVGQGRTQMMQQLLDGNSQAFERSLQALFAHIPYELHIPKEAYYHSLLLLWLNLLGFKVDAEVNTDKGRIDAVWTWAERVVIAEVKYAETGDTGQLLEVALLQIHEKKYAERYAGNSKRIALLGVAFVGKEVACRMEELSILE
ncbi:ATPase AAA [Bacteroidia bacterium]|nr:ATPase AAA [Bacteroidia bacterium]